MKVFVHQTRTDISPGQNVPQLMVRNGDFTTKEKKNPFLGFKMFTKYSHNFDAVCGKKKLKDAK